MACWVVPVPDSGLFLSHVISYSNIPCLARNASIHTLGLQMVIHKEKMTETYQYQVLCILFLANTLSYDDSIIDNGVAVTMSDLECILTRGFLKP